MFMVTSPTKARPTPWRASSASAEGLCAWRNTPAHRPRAAVGPARALPLATVERRESCCGFHFGRSTLRPDPLPVIRAQLLQRDSPARNFDDRRTEMGGNRPLAGLPLISLLVRATQQSNQFRQTAHSIGGKFNSVHGNENYSIAVLLSSIADSPQQRAKSTYAEN